MIRYTMVLGALFFLGLPLCGADDTKDKEPAAVDLLSKGLTKAKAEEKVVFLIFGSPTCGWCKLFDKYHADPLVTRILDKHMVLVKVDIVKNLGGEAMYKKYGSDRGVPAFTLLDPAQNVMADSGDGKDNIGFPAEPKEIEHYFVALKKSCPRLSPTEIETLTNKLKEIGKTTK